jgi:hypothetical protein
VFRCAERPLGRYPSGGGDAFRERVADRRKLELDVVAVPVGDDGGPGGPDRVPPLLDARGVGDGGGDADQYSADDSVEVV